MWVVEVAGDSVLRFGRPCHPYRRRQWHPTPVLLPGKSHGQRSLVGCSPWGREQSDMTERLHFHFSLSCIGEGNGNPLQCSCLENPRDRGAWWAAVYGVHRVGHDWSDLAAAAAILIRQKTIAAVYLVYCILILCHALAYRFTTTTQERDKLGSTGEGT